jgi:asparagine synthetase B (glutamine-hydrolysing)
VNGILGIASRAGASRELRTAAERLANTEQGMPRLQSGATEELAWALTASGGAAIGTATSDGLALGFLGGFHRPFPSAGGRSPLDDADATAAELLARYRRLGDAFLDGLCGHFAVLLVDPRDRRAVLARAPGGCQRWFVAERAGALLFSTRIADFAGLLGAALEVDRSLEDFLLAYEFLPGNRTLYRGVRALEPGRMLTWRAGELSERALPEPDPWPRRFESVDLTDEDTVASALHEAFTAAVTEQLPDSGPVGVLLGGVDSALIAATVSRLGREVHTFSFRYDDPSYNQAHTEELAQLFGLTHHWVPITPAVIRDGLLHYAQRFNQVVGQPHYVIASAHCCAAARDAGVLHVLTGDGCDGLFLGYPTVHTRAKLIQSLSRFAPLVATPLDWLTRSAWLERKLGHPYRIARNVARILRRPMPARAHIAACTLDSRSLRQLRGAPLTQERDSEEILRSLATGLENVHPIRLAYLGKGRVGLNLVKLEGASSFSGVALNSPYLHPGFARLAKRIPEALLRPAGAPDGSEMGKHVFLRMVRTEQLLPDRITFQRKRSPVTAPVDHWYWGGLRSFLLDRLALLPFSPNREFAESLVTEKWAEKWFRERIGLSRHVTQAVGLLATYASFSDLQDARANDLVR